MFRKYKCSVPLFIKIVLLLYYILRARQVFLDYLIWFSCKWYCKYKSFIMFLFYTFILLTNARYLFLYRLLLYWYATLGESDDITMFTNLSDLTDMHRERTKHRLEKLWTWTDQFKNFQQNTIGPTSDISTMMIETHNSTLALLMERYYNWAELPVFTEPAGAP